MPFPGRTRASQLDPQATRLEPVAAVVERVGMFKGERVVSVKLASAGQRDRCCAEEGSGADRNCPENAAGDVAVAILVAARRSEAVDTGGALPPHGSGE